MEGCVDEIYDASLTSDGTIRGIAAIWSDGIIRRRGKDEEEEGIDASMCKENIIMMTCKDKIKDARSQLISDAVGSPAAQRAVVVVMGRHECGHAT